MTCNVVYHCIVYRRFIVHTRIPQMRHGDLKGVSLSVDIKLKVYSGDSASPQSNKLVMLSQEKFGRQDVPHIQLCEFGLTKVDDHSFGLTTCFTTTNQFEAPELRKTKMFTTASDMYAFGGVLLQVRPCTSSHATPCAYKISDPLFQVPVFVVGSSRSVQAGEDARGLPETRRGFANPLGINAQVLVGNSSGSA